MIKWISALFKKTDIRLIRRLKSGSGQISVNEADKIPIEVFISNIGKQTHKTSKRGAQPNPFKSGNKTNTIKGVIEHPILKIPAYTFEEDESYVECRRCIIINV